MNEDQLTLLKRTFPWRTQVVHTNMGGLVQVIDRNGVEVPIFSMTKFLEIITSSIYKESADREAAPL